MEDADWKLIEAVQDDLLDPAVVMGLSHPLLKFSGGSGDDYATIPDDSSSPS